MIWLCGILVLARPVYMWLFPAEGRAIQDAMEADNNVEAYFYSWYEGQTLNSYIWVEEGYYKMSYIGIEAFSSPGGVVLWQVGNLRLSCTVVTDDFPVAEYNSTHGISIGYIAKLMGQDPEEYSLHDLFSDYVDIYNRVTLFPEAPAGEIIPAYHRSLKFIRSRGDNLYCWKRPAEQPGLPLERGAQMEGNGYYFYRRVEN